MIVLWILLIIAAVILIILTLPVAVRAAYNKNSDVILEVYYGFIKIDILKLLKKEKAKTKPKKEPQKATKKEAPKKKPKEKKSLDDLLNLLSTIKDLITAALPAFGFVLRHIVIENIYLNVKVSCEDACDTAVQYGRLSAACASLSGLIKNVFKVKKYRVILNPDFTAGKSEVEGDLKLSVMPIIVLVGAIKFLIAYLKIQRNKQIEENSEEIADKQQIRKTVDKK